MLRKLKNLLTQNIGLKILSVLVAVALWLVVMNYDDPIITNTYSDIQVEILNPELLTDQDKVYEVLSNTDTVDVTVEGKRSVIDSLSKENIKASADVSQLTEVNNVPIRFYTNKNNNQLESITGDHSLVQLSIEDRIEKHLPIELSVTGQPADGCVVGDKSIAQNTVRISGPESVVSSISKAKCSVSVAGRSSDIASSADIRLYNSAGEEMSHANLTKNISAVNVTVAILETKAVSIIYAYTGTPAEGYAVAGDPVADHRAVRIAGRASVIADISAIVIPGEALLVDGLDDDLVTVVDIKDYLANGVRIADDESGDSFDGKVNVTVDIEPLVERKLEVPIANIQPVNVPEGFEAEVLLENYEVEDEERGEVVLEINTEGIEGSYIKQDGGSVTGKDVTGTMNVQAYFDQNNSAAEEGIYRMRVSFTMPEGISVKGSTYAEVDLTYKAEE